MSQAEDLKKIVEALVLEKNKTAAEVRDAAREGQEAVERMQRSVYRLYDLVSKLSEKLLRVAGEFQKEGNAQ